MAASCVVFSLNILQLVVRQVASIAGGGGNNRYCLYASELAGVVFLKCWLKPFIKLASYL